MTRKKRIALVLLFVLVLLPAALYVTRNQWVALLLKSTVSSRSKGQVTLSFKSIEVGVFSRTLVIHEPELRFRHVYFNRAVGTTLDRALFSRLVLTNLSLGDVILHKQFIIADLLLEKPAFILGKDNPVKARTKKKGGGFNPSRLIEVMQNHEVAHLRFAFLVRHTYINFGKIELNGKKGSNVYGGARYNVSVENMGTIRTSGDTLHPLTFDNLELTVRAFHRYSAPEKLNITFDSAFYSSQSKRLVLRGMHVDILDKNLKNPPVATFRLRWADISGLESRKQPKNTKALHLGRIKVVGGDFLLRPFSRGRKKKTPSGLLHDLFTAYRLVLLDTLNVRHVSVASLNKKGDTVLVLKRLNLAVHKLWAYRNVLNDPVKNLHFKTMGVSYSKLAYGNSRSPLQVRSGNMAYDSKNKKIAVENLFLHTRCTNGRDTTSLFYVRAVEVGNFSAEKLQHMQSQLLSLKLTAPSLYLKKDTACARSRFLLPDILKSLQPERITIKNGQFRYRKSTGFALGLSGIDLFADSLPGTVLSGPGARLQYDSLFFLASKSYFTNSVRNENMQSGKLVWDNRTFKISNLRYFHSDTSGYDTLQLGHLTLVKPRLNPLLFGKTLMARGAYFYKADFRSGRFNSVSRIDTFPVHHWNHYIKMPFKANIGVIRIMKSRFMLAARQPQKNFSIGSQLDMKLIGFKMGYDTARLLAQPKHWKAVLRKTEIQRQNTTVGLQKIVLNSDSGTLFMRHIEVGNVTDTGEVRYKIRIPSVSLQSVRFGALFRSDSLIFGKAVIHAPVAHIRLVDFTADTLTKKIRRWHFIFDSLKFDKARLGFRFENHGNSTTLQVNNLNLLYHPQLHHALFTRYTEQNLIKQWDFDAEKVVFSDLQRKLKVVADRVALQSEMSRLHIKKIIGTNFTPEMADPGNRQVFSYFLLSDMSFNNLTLSGKNQRFLHVKQWSLPAAWVNIINNGRAKSRKSLDFLNSNFFSRYTRFVSGIHVDSSVFKDVNVSYQYDSMTKLVNIVQLAINTQDIQLGKPFLPGTSNALFGTMFVNLNDRSIISGDSLYAFRMRDIRINLPQRKIRFDSITLTPRFNKTAFFKRVGHQTDRITLYGKSAVLDNFNTADLLNGHFIHFGNMQLNNISVRFERDMHYPRNHAVKPMPFELFNSIPYKFKIDTMGLNNCMISYFEYEVKSKNPGIFFIDHFQVRAQNVTNHFMPGDSNLVLKVQGSGKLMKQAKLDFTLVMPYFAPKQQWWFSADAGKIDLTQFNPLTENVLGLTVHSGMGSLHVPMITGDSVSAHGKVEFLYRKLKIRVYNRKKSEKSKKFWTPFANMIINGLVVKSNNPPFLGHVKKGIVYYERNPEKSFINYLWKSNLSGILSTIGFNNKQQREFKREEKKQTDTSGKSGLKPSKEPAGKQKK